MIEWLAALKGLISAKVDNAIHFSANPNTVITKRSKESTQNVTYNNTGNGNINVFQFQLSESGEANAEAMEQLKKYYFQHLSLEMYCYCSRIRKNY